ncbi:MAG: ATP-binding protein [Pseudomonadota bacterium]
MGSGSIAPPDDLPRHVLDHLLEGVQVISPEYRYLYVNEAVAAHGRQTREALLGRTMMAAYPGIDQAPFFPLLRRCMEERVPHTMLNEFTYPDGARGWFELRMEPVLAGVVIFSMDVSERVRAEEALRRSRRALTVLSECNQSLVRATEEGSFVQGLCRLVVEKGGYRMAHLHLVEGGTLRPAASATAEGLWDEGGLTRALDDLAAAVSRTGEAAVRRLAGFNDPAWLAAVEGLGVASSLALPVQFEGEPLGVLGLHAAEPDAFDEEERRLLDELALDLGYGIGIQRVRRQQEAMMEQLARAQRLEAVGRLAGGVAHDFNNLLTVILSSADFALENKALPPAVQGEVEAILEAGQRAAALTRQLLAFSRRQVLHPEVLDLNSVVCGVENLLRRLLGEDIRIVVELSDQIELVEADPGQLEQVLVNLAVNARDAMPRGGSLHIGTSVGPGGGVRLTVADTGCGMEPEVLARVFEPFFTTKEPGRGTGLGLSMAYGVVTQSGGEIEVQSAPGEGTTFTITLPGAARREAPPAAAAQPEVDRGKGTVLLAEDDAAVRALTARMLVRAGYYVLEAASGEEALALVRAMEAPIDLLLTDVVMPGMDGPALAARLPELPVLFMSGYTEDAIERCGVFARDVPFLAKPFDMATLARMVGQVMARGQG